MNDKKEFKCGCCRKITLNSHGVYEQETFSFLTSELKDIELCHQCYFDYQWLDAGLKKRTLPLNIKLMNKSFEMSLKFTDYTTPDEELYTEIVPTIYRLLELKEYDPVIYNAIAQEQRESI